VPVDLGGGGVYAAANTISAVVALVQMGVIELHAWGSTTKNLGCPDRMVLDLDPDARVPWREVMAAAHHVRERLEDLGLESFVKTTGGKGLHVVVPLAPRHDWDELKQFSRALAESIAAERPKDFTARPPSASARAASTSTGFATPRAPPRSHPTPCAHERVRPVATPLHWDEVGGRMRPTKYHAGNVAKRLHGLHSDPWKQLRRKHQVITAAMKRKLDLKP
jgi:bifunctional non-homologous end joining protein LigD